MQERQRGVGWSEVGRDSSDAMGKAAGMGWDGGEDTFL